MAVVGLCMQSLQGALHGLYPFLSLLDFRRTDIFALTRWSLRFLDLLYATMGGLAKILFTLRYHNVKGRVPESLCSCDRLMVWPRKSRGPPRKCSLAEVWLKARF